MPKIFSSPLNPQSTHHKPKSLDQQRKDFFRHAVRKEKSSVSLLWNSTKHTLSRSNNAIKRTCSALGIQLLNTAVMIAKRSISLNNTVKTQWSKGNNAIQQTCSALGSKLLDTAVMIVNRSISLNNTVKTKWSKGNDAIKRNFSAFAGLLFRKVKLSVAWSKGIKAFIFNEKNTHVDFPNYIMNGNFETMCSYDRSRIAEHKLQFHADMTSKLSYENVAILDSKNQPMQYQAVKNNPMSDVSDVFYNTTSHVLSYWDKEENKLRDITNSDNQIIHYDLDDQSFYFNDFNDNKVICYACIVNSQAYMKAIENNKAEPQLEWDETAEAKAADGRTETEAADGPTEQTLSRSNNAIKRNFSAFAGLLFRKVKLSVAESKRIKTLIFNEKDTHIDCPNYIMNGDFESMSSDDGSRLETHKLQFHANMTSESPYENVIILDSKYQPMQYQAVKNGPISDVFYHTKSHVLSYWDSKEHTWCHIKNSDNQIIHYDFDNQNFYWKDNNDKKVICYASKVNIQADKEAIDNNKAIPPLEVDGPAEAEPADGPTEAEPIDEPTEDEAADGSVEAEPTDGSTVYAAETNKPEEKNPTFQEMLARSYGPSDQKKQDDFDVFEFLSQSKG